MVKTLLEKGLRLQSAAPVLQTTTAAEIAKITGAVKARLVMDTKFACERLHFVNKDGNYISVKVGATCELTKEGDERVAELINNYTIYCGDKDQDGNPTESPWFTFGKQPAPKDPIAEVNLSELLGFKVG